MNDDPFKCSVIHTDILRETIAATLKRGYRIEENQIAYDPEMHRISRELRSFWLEFGKGKWAYFAIPWTDWYDLTQLGRPGMMLIDNFYGAAIYPQRTPASDMYYLSNGDGWRIGVKLDT